MGHAWGAYNNWMYFPFTVDGLMTKGLIRAAVIIRDLAPYCFITSFYKHIFPTFIGLEIVVVQLLQ